METIWMIQKAFRDDAMSAAQVKVWHKRFKDRQESFESDAHSGRPITNRTPENVECVWAAINKDFWLSPKLKSPLKRKRFQIINEIQENTMGQLMAIPTKDFAEYSEQWKRCWENCEVPRCLL